jgi:taurine---2-oxoglutarate transaminase
MPQSWPQESGCDRIAKTLLNTKEEKITGKPLVVDRAAAEMMKQGVAVQAWISHFVILRHRLVETTGLTLLSFDAF